MSYYLFLFEFKKYFKTKLTSELRIDLSKQSKNLRVYIDILFYQIPCSLIDLDISDFLGNIKEINELSKQPINKYGEEISGLLNLNFKEEKLGNVSSKQNERIYNFTKNAFLNENGCKMFGAFELRRVPGNFYFTVSHHKQTLERIDQNMNVTFNLSHKINELSFGFESHVKYVKNNYKIGKLNPLDNIIKIDDKEALTHNYFLNIVPTEYFGKKNKTYNVFQFTGNYFLKKDSNEPPEIAFYYDLSPIKIIYQYSIPNNFDGIVNICAIIGGIFTFAGILNSFLLRINQLRHDKRF